MDYPGSKFTLPFRRGILLFFIVAFLIISPAVIMYTAGYRYDWSGNFWRETGSLSIDVLPKNAAVYADGEKLNSKIPVRLKNIATKKYNIKITAPNYYDWENEIEILEKQTYYIKDISLLQKNEPELLVAGQIDQIFSSADAKFLIYTKETDKNQEIWMKNNEQGKNTLLFTWPKNIQIKTEWSEQNNYLAISDDQSPYNKLIIINTNDTTKQIDLIKKVKYPIEKYQWKESLEPELFFSTNLKILSYLPDTDRQNTIIKNDYLDWYMENGQLWTLQAMAKTANQINVVRDTLGFSSIFKIVNSTDKTLKILKIKNDLVLLKTSPDKMLLLTNNKNQTGFEIAASNFIISPYQKKWLFWTPWELRTYSEDNISNEKEEPTLLNRSGEQLQEVVPMDKYNTLALVWSDQTTALFHYYYVNHTLLDYPIRHAVADSVNHYLYYTTSHNNQTGLWRLKY